MNLTTDDNETAPYAGRNYSMSGTETAVLAAGGIYVYRVILTIMLPLGLIGNTLAFFTLQRSSFRNYAANTYFMALAVADNMVRGCPKFTAWGRGTRVCGQPQRKLNVFPSPGPWNLNVVPSLGSVL